MSMFNTIGTDIHATERKPNTLRKLERMNKALRHEEPDRVPISDFLWDDVAYKQTTFMSPA